MRELSMEEIDMVSGAGIMSALNTFSKVVNVFTGIEYTYGKAISGLEYLEGTAFGEWSKNEYYTYGCYNY